jgi:hypothetical protein
MNFKIITIAITISLFFLFLTAHYANALTISQKNQTKIAADSKTNTKTTKHVYLSIHVLGK